MSRVFQLPNSSLRYEYAVRDERQRILLAGSASNSIDLSQLGGDFFFVSLTAGLQKLNYQLLYRPNEQQPFFTAIDAYPGAIELIFADASASPIFVSVRNSDGASIFEAWHYGRLLRLDLPEGSYSVGFALPSSAQTAARINVGSGNALAPPPPPPLLVDAPSFDTEYNYTVRQSGETPIKSGVTRNALDVSGLPVGEYIVEFTRAGVQSKTGFIIDERLPAGILTLERGSGSGFVFDLDDFGSKSAVYARFTRYDGNAVFEGWIYRPRIELDLPAGAYRAHFFYSDGGQSFSGTFRVGLDGSVSTDIRSSAAIEMPSDWSGWRLADPAGNTLKAGAESKWIDFSDLPEGRYTLSDATAPAKRLNVVVDDEIIGGVLTIAQSVTGEIRIDWSDPASRPYYAVMVTTPSGVLKSTWYAYGSEATILGLDEDARVFISGPGESGFSVDLKLEAGALQAVNQVGIQDREDWYLDIAKPIAALAPITFNDGLTRFSFAPVEDSRYVVQVRDLSTGTLSTWFSDDPQVAVELDPGLFEWRALELPNQEILDPLVVEKLFSVRGGWHFLEQRSDALRNDYVFGLEPDRVSSVDDLRLSYPTDAIRLADGSIILSNSYASSLVRIHPDGAVTRVAGGTRAGFVESGPGSEALLDIPAQLFLASDRELLFADQGNNVIRRLDLVSGQVSVFLGTPDSAELRIEGGQVTSVGNIYDIGRDAAGLLYFTSQTPANPGQPDARSVHVVRQASDGSWYDWNFDLTGISPSAAIYDALWHDGLVSMIIADQASKKYIEFDESGRQIFSADLGSPFGGGLTKDPLTGDVLVGGHTVLYRVNVSTKAISQEPLDESFANISALSVRGTQLLITDSDRGLVLSQDLVSKKMTTVAGYSSGASNTFIDLLAQDGALLALDNITPRLLRAGGDGVTVLAGSGVQAETTFGSLTRTDIDFRFPNAVASDNRGGFIIAESNHRLVRIDPSSNVTLFAGALDAGYAGDGGPATEARFRSIYGVDTGPDETVYVADTFNHAIRRIDTDGIVTTIAGNGTAGLSKTDATTGAVLNAPWRVLVTPTGSLLVSDSWNNRVVEITEDGRLLPVAGIDNPGPYQGSGNFSGDGGLAVAAALNTPMGLALHDDGTLFIADAFNDRIRYVDIGGKIHTLVGGDRGYEFAKLLNLPADVAVIGDDVFVADTGNALVLRLGNADRTGNDLRSALDVDAAVAKHGRISRTEHVDPSDSDVYSFTSVSDNSVLITGDGVLNLKLWGWDDASAQQVTVAPGNGFSVDAGLFQAVEVSASIGTRYHAVLGPNLSSGATVQVPNSLIEPERFDAAMPIVIRPEDAFASASIPLRFSDHFVLA